MFCGGRVNCAWPNREPRGNQCFVVLNLNCLIGNLDVVFFVVTGLIVMLEVSSTGRLGT